MGSLLKQPSAWIPIAMSFGMLAAILIVLAMLGIPTPDPNADEGVGAHLFQIWLVLEVLMVAFFALTWLPRRPAQALFVLTIQIVAVLAACAPVFILKL